MDIISRMADLQIDDTAKGVIGSNVMYAAREYLLAQLKAPRCGDNVTASTAPSTFNAALRRAKAELDVTPINPNALPPPTMLGVARIDSYWQTSQAARLHDAAARLHGPGTAPLPMRVRQAQEWRTQAERLLNDIDQWSGKSEREERDYFYQKAVLYTGSRTWCRPERCTRRRCDRLSSLCGAARPTPAGGCCGSRSSIACSR